MKKTAKISYKTFLLISFAAVVAFCCVLRIKAVYRQKMESEVKVELRAAGLYDGKKKTLEFVEGSTGDVCFVKTKGILLIGSDTVYPVLNHLCLGLNHGDSVYVVNGLALSYLPTAEQLRHELPPSKTAVKISFAIALLLAGMLVAEMVRLYWKRYKQSVKKNC